MVKKDEKIERAKEKALNLALEQIEKKYGKGAIMHFAKERPLVKIEAISTGALSLDAALGIGGVPRGRIVELFGTEGGGKTTLSLHIIAEAQRLGGEAAFIDVEHAMDPAYAKALGVDLERLVISQPDSGEQALEITEALVRSGAVDIIVIDSVAALVPRAEIEGEMGDTQVGLQARLMSKALRKLTSVISKSKTCALFINQVRMKIGMMGYGSPETTPGGRALKFYSSVRMDIRRIGAIKEGPNIIGNRTVVKIAKNKVAPPFRRAEFDIIYGKGISREGCLIDLGLEKGIIARSGAWFSYKKNRIGQGREGVRTFLQKNPKIARELKKEIRKLI
jgi:recombination protein RecA